MASLYLILIYVAASAFVGFLGRKRAVGFAGIFVLSLFLTPLVMALFLMVAAPRANNS